VKLRDEICCLTKQLRAKKDTAGRSNIKRRIQRRVHAIERLERLNLERVTRHTGQLEIDHDRGVIYFHAATGKLAGATLLRICSLPKPIPRDKQLDVTHMHGCDWRVTKPTYACSNRHHFSAPEGSPEPMLGMRCPQCREWVNFKRENEATVQRTGDAADANGDEFDQQ
jgi:hypothetical protein